MIDPKVLSAVVALAWARTDAVVEPAAGYLIRCILFGVIANGLAAGTARAGTHSFPVVWNPEAYGCTGYDIEAEQGDADGPCTGEFKSWVESAARDTCSRNVETFSSYTVDTLTNQGGTFFGRGTVMCVVRAKSAQAQQPVAATAVIDRPEAATQKSSVVARREPDWPSPTMGTMKWIPTGSFLMGSAESERGRFFDETQHQVTLTKGFWLMEHEVTQEQWQAVMGSNPVASGNDPHHQACSVVGVGPNLPVACVSWEEAVVFAQRVSAQDGVTYALPTEAQWEYAARGGQTGAWAGTSSADAVCGVANVANFASLQAYFYGLVGVYPTGMTRCDDRYAGLAPVGSLSVNGYGLYDMSGNVREWVSDWLGPYASGSVADPTGAASGTERVCRGGSWGAAPERARVSNRFGCDPGDRSIETGLRLLRTSP